MAPLTRRRCRLVGPTEPDFTFSYPTTPTSTASDRVRRGKKPLVCPTRCAAGEGVEKAGDATGYSYCVLVSFSQQVTHSETLRCLDATPGRQACWHRRLRLCVWSTAACAEPSGSHQRSRRLDDLCSSCRRSWAHRGRPGDAPLRGLEVHGQRQVDGDRGGGEGAQRRDEHLQLILHPGGNQERMPCML